MVLVAFLVHNIEQGPEDVLHCSKAMAPIRKLRTLTDTGTEQGTCIACTGKRRFC